MSGLDKILQDIREEADAAANVLLNEAKEKADALVSEARDETQKILDAEKKRAEADAASAVLRSESSADLKKRQMILAKKQELIGAVLEKAKKQLLALSDEDYFAAMKKLALSNAQQGEGSICFCARDLERIPASFETELNEALKDKGASLTVSDKACAIDGGFLLSYGGIEENCSFEAMFRANEESLSDAVQRILFEQQA